MSEVQQGPLWRQRGDGAWEWQASDGNWYPQALAPPIEGEPDEDGWGDVAVPSTMPAGAWLSIIGGVLMGVGAFLPWITATDYIASASRNAFQFGADDGFSADGAILVGLGIVTVLIGITRLTHSAMPRFIQRSPIVTGVVAGLMIANRAPWINSEIHGAKATVIVSYGLGVYMVGIAAAVALVGGIVLGPTRAQWDARARAMGAPHHRGNPPEAPETIR